MVFSANLARGIIVISAATVMAITSSASAGSVTFRDGSTDHPYTPPAIVPGASTFFTLGVFSLQPDASGSVDLTSVTIRLDGQRTANNQIYLFASTDNVYNYAFDTALASVPDPGAGNEATFSGFSYNIPASTERYFYIAVAVVTGSTGTLQGFIDDSSRISIGSGNTLTNITTNEPISTTPAALPVRLSAYTIE